LVPKDGRGNPLGGGNRTLITTATTTYVKASAGRIGRILVAGGVMGAITVYDDADGTTNKVFVFTPAAAGEIKELECPMTDGITVVTAAATEITVTWI
jgi:hypothetical protein